VLNYSLSPIGLLKEDGMDYRLSPSDLTFLYEGCKRCFVLKVKHGISQPSIPLPGVFSLISGLQKEHYSGRRTTEFCPQLPPGTVTLGEQHVRSTPFRFPDLEGTCTLGGRFDVVVEFDDKSFGVIDFKTGNPSEGKAGMYGRQLHAYALALERPAEGALGLGPVSRLGLFYFTPETCDYTGNSRQTLEGKMTWIEVKRDDAAFEGFLHKVVSLLDGPLPDPDPDKCDWCRYLETGRDTSSVPKCPNCGGGMRLRSGRMGKFWGCMNYPDCKGTRPA
jgi:hypothetical protein